METQTYQHFDYPAKRTVFDDGFTLFTVDTASAFVLCKLLIDKGSWDDGELSGIAHFIEHLLCEGPARDGIHPRFRHLALQGVITNAGTNTDHTHYRAFGPASHCIPIITGLLGMCFDEEAITPANIDTERGVILQELRQREKRSQLNELITRHLYPHLNPYRPAGHAQDVERITKPDLLAFFAKHYTATQSAMIVAGGVQHEELVAEIAPFVERLPRGEPRAPRTELFPRTDSTDFSGRSVDHPVTEYIIPVPLDDRTQIALGYAADLLAHSHLALLLQELRVNRRICYEANASVGHWPIGSFSTSVGAAPHHFTEVEERVWSQIECIQRNAFPEDLFQLIRVHRQLGRLEQQETRDRDVLTNNLKLRWLEQDYRDINWREVKDQMGREEISAIATQYLTPEKRARIRFLPK